MQEMFDMIMKHKQAMQEMQVMWEKAVRDHQHEYDSDEEVDQDDGTWEHRLRQMEMEKTRGEPCRLRVQVRVQVRVQIRVQIRVQVQKATVLSAILFQSPGFAH